VTFPPKNHNKGYPKIAISTEIKNNNTKPTIDHAQSLARKPLKLRERCARHHFRGLFIRVATILASSDMNIGAKPPPTNHSITERSIRTPAPYLLSTKAHAHIVTNRPKVIARMPVTKKFGIIVKARSVPYSQNLYTGPIAFINMPSDATLHWSVSKNPCSMPASPTRMPNVEATVFVALVGVFCRCEGTEIPSNFNLLKEAHVRLMTCDSDS
jgi:hypothetical protein